MPNKAPQAHAAQAQRLLLDKHEVEALLPPDGVLLAVHEAFVLHGRGEGRVFPLVREQLAAGLLGIKSGDVQDQGLMGFKAAGFWPGNRAAETEPHQATIRLMDPATATPGTSPLFDAGAVPPGAHLNCAGVGTRCKREPPEGLLAWARLFVDDKFRRGRSLRRNGCPTWPAWRWVTC